MKVEDRKLLAAGNWGRVAGVACQAGVQPVLLLAAVLALFLQPAFSQRAPTSLVVTSEPGAVVWIDEIRRGVTDESGRLEVKKLSPGSHAVRVRAAGIREATAPLPPGRKSLNVKLVKTSDAAELMFQQAEAAREKARDDPAREAAAVLYRETIKLRSAFPAAHLGLARVLLDLNKTQDALEEIQAANQRKIPEAVSALNSIPVSASEARAEALFNLAQTYARMRQWEQARTTIEELRRDFSSSKFTPRAMVSVGMIAKEARNEADASYFLRTAVNSYQDSIEVAQAQFDLAWISAELRH